IEARAIEGRGRARDVIDDVDPTQGLGHGVDVVEPGVGQIKGCARGRVLELGQPRARANHRSNLVAALAQDLAYVAADEPAGAGDQGPVWSVHQAKSCS